MPFMIQSSRYGTNVIHFYVRNVEYNLLMKGFKGLSITRPIHWPSTVLTELNPALDGFKERINFFESNHEL
jgi:hypothetical protein